MVEIYWLTRLATISEAVGVIFILAGIALVVLSFMHGGGFCEDFDIDEKKFTKIMKGLAVTCAVTFVLSLFLPTKKDMLFIFGVGTVYDIVKDDPTAKQIPHDAIKAIDEWLKEDKDK